MTLSVMLETAITAARAAGPVEDTPARAMALIDLTNLDDTCTPAAIDALVKGATTPLGKVAALCVWPRFVAQSKAGIAGTGIKLATVVNFPAGGLDAGATALEIKGGIADGADEIDIVFPWQAFLAGDRAAAAAMLRAARDTMGPDVVLKVILESGAYPDLAQVRAASELAIECGADFLKTSTGKIPQGASLEAAAVMLDVIEASGLPVGFKASGGIRDAATAAHYLALADRLMGPGWVSPARFRFGASGLKDALLTAGSAAVGVY